MSNMQAIFAIFLALFQISSVFSRTSPELLVNLTDGTVLGRYMTSNSGRTIRAFMGIPFAHPPINELRFRAPQKVKPWKPNTLVAQTEPHKCAQFSPFAPDSFFEGQEDCLYLNVYAPEIDNSYANFVKHPVMVFFHGGSFYTGHAGVSESGPDYFLDTDVILVAGNYRLGPLGFLSTEDEQSPGNYGLKDQAAVLRWVNENIESFGGDKNLVTIFGESVGGASVNYHMLSPLSQNLFHRAISQSGTLQQFWGDPAQPGEAKERAKELAEYLNCTNVDNSEEILKCLRSATAKDLSLSLRYRFSSITEYTTPFLPVMENLTQTVEEPFITVETFKLNDVMRKIPWMVGINSEEGAFSTAFMFSDDGVQLYDWTDRMPKYLGYDHLNEVEQEEVTREIREFYFNNDPISYEKITNVTNVLTDSSYFGMFDILEGRLSNSNLNNTYLYFYTHEGAASYTETAGRQKFIGTAHMDELLSLFPLYKYQQFYSAIPTDFDRALHRIMPNLWVNFARTGNPNLGHVNPLTHSDQFWPSAYGFPLDYMRIGNENGRSRRLLEVKRDLLPERVAFWRKLKAKHPIIRRKL